MLTSASSAMAPQVSVIIPARNEEANIGNCLESLIDQDISFEIIVVDDHSTDRTREIAQSFGGVQVVEADPLRGGWTGKNNAVATGVRHARGEWLLLTDADTIHLPGSLSRALAEAREHRVNLLSYSPEQIAITFWEMAILPVVFAELARKYPPAKVSDPNSPEAAANGQYILIRRDAYDAVGGHAAIASSILEDVALARAIKASGRKIRFRYAADAVRTRMYRNFRQLREGWTKNLALLFPKPGWLAAETLLWWALPWILLSLPLAASLAIPYVSSLRRAFGNLSSIYHQWWWFAVFYMAAARNVFRLRRGNFDIVMEFLGACFGMPVFAYLLLRSRRMHRKGDIPWKGRRYEVVERPMNKAAEKTPDIRQKNLLKRRTILAAAVILLLLRGSDLRLMALGGLHPQPTLPTQGSEAAPHFTSITIEPGMGVGPLKLGDSRERALELFPKKDEDQQWDDPCGTTLDWVDSTNPMGRGDIFVRLKKGKVFQIESTTTRFRTADDITTFDSPEKVANAYKDMRAWVLLTPPIPSLGDRPLVFWIDKKKGIAFAFAYDPSHRKRYLYKVIVFEPNKEFCPEQEKITSPKWQQIHPYAIEPPIELSPESQ